LALPLAVILSAAKHPSCISPLPSRVPHPSILRVGLFLNLNDQPPSRVAVALPLRCRCH
jgi:hypothetical protein